MVLKAIRNRAGVGAAIDFEAVFDSVAVEDLMKLGSVETQAILIAHVHGDGFILLQISDVLIDESQWRVGRPLGLNIGLWNAVFGGKVGVEGRVLRIG